MPSHICVITHQRAERASRFHVTTFTGTQEEVLAACVQGHMKSVYLRQHPCARTVVDQFWGLCAENAVDEDQLGRCCQMPLDVIIKQLESLIEDDGEFGAAMAVVAPQGEPRALAPEGGGAKPQASPRTVPPTPPPTPRLVPPTPPPTPRVPPKNEFAVKEEKYSDIPSFGEASGNVTWGAPKASWGAPKAMEDAPKVSWDAPKTPWDVPPAQWRLTPPLGMAVLIEPPQPARLGPSHGNPYRCAACNYATPYAGYFERHLSSNDHRSRCEGVVRVIREATAAGSGNVWGSKRMR
jgi:hypothetical protein